MALRPSKSSNRNGRSLRGTGDQGLLKTPVAAEADLRYSLKWETTAAASAQPFSADLESFESNGV
jgi:hypothetical protein